MDSRLGNAAFGLAVLALVVATQRSLFAGFNIQAPEIDGSSLSTGLVLLAAGALIVRSRFRSK